jgi:hypothetical protein
MDGFIYFFLFNFHQSGPASAVFKTWLNPAPGVEQHMGRFVPAANENNDFDITICSA